MLAANVAIIHKGTETSLDIDFGREPNKSAPANPPSNHIKNILTRDILLITPVLTEFICEVLYVFPSRVMVSPLKSDIPFKSIAMPTILQKIQSWSTHGSVRKSYNVFHH